MTDPKTGAKPVNVTLPDGSTRSYPQLSPADWVQLGNTLQAVRKQRRRVELEGSDPSAVAKAMDDIDRRPVRYTDVVKFVDTLEGSYYVLRAATAKADPAAADDAIEAAIGELGSPVGWLSIAAALCGLKTEVLAEDVSVPPPAGDGEPAAPPPQDPKPTSIGSTSPPESGTT